MKYWQSRTLIRLEKLWYEKLKDDGFIDIEKIIGSNRVLIQRASNGYRQASEIERESKLTYYRLLSIHGHDEVFPDKVTEIVMLRRSSGYKIKEICEELKGRGDRCHRQTVRYIIRHYENKWGIKKWTKNQLNPNLKKLTKALTR